MPQNNQTLLEKTVADQWQTLPSGLTVLVRPPMDDLLDADDTTIARRMNEEVEVFVKPHTEQYTWILKLLKTRKPGEIEPYKRKELFPKKK